MGRRTILLALVFLALSTPLTATTRVGSVGTTGQKLYGFLPPFDGGQVLVTVSWAPKTASAIVVLMCALETEPPLLFGGYASLASDRTARIESGVLGDVCVVGVSGFEGRINFRLNVQVATEESPMLMLRSGEGAASLRRGRVVDLNPAEHPEVVQALQRFGAALQRRR